MVKKAADYKWSSYDCYLNEENFFAKILEPHTILGLFSEERKDAVGKFKEYMNEKPEESFIDLEEEVETMDEEEAKELFKRMLLGEGPENNKELKAQLSDRMIKELSAKTNLSVRKIATITGLSKDKANRMLKS